MATALINSRDENFKSECKAYFEVYGYSVKERIVYFSINAKLLLEEYLRQRKGSMLFVNTRAPYTAMHTHSIQKIIRRLGEQAELSERIHPHLLRHTHASMLFAGGTTSQEISKRLRHTRVATTDDIYIHVDEDIISKLENTSVFKARCNRAAA